MKKNSKVMEVILTLLSSLFEIFAGGIGAYYFMQGVARQNYFLCGACIVLFFALFWAMFAERLKIELGREKSRNGK